MRRKWYQQFTIDRRVENACNSRPDNKIEGNFEEIMPCATDRIDHSSPNA
jgi:hypothetical protein